MAILPLQLARVSQTLQTSVATGNITSTEQQLLEVQNELSTGKSLNEPSDNPGSAAIAQQLQKTLEQRQSYSDNITAANDQLGEVDSTLSDLTDLVRQAQTIASANVGSDVTSDQRTSAAAVVQSLYDQMLELGKQAVRGRLYLWRRSLDDAAVRRSEQRRAVRWIDNCPAKSIRREQFAFLPG